jgi:hypothetical protein
MKAKLFIKGDLDHLIEMTIYSNALHKDDTRQQHINDSATKPTKANDVTLSL